MEIFELLFQVFEKWGAIGLVSIALIFISMNGSRGRLELTKALSAQAVKDSELNKTQEDNAAVSEERWHDRMESYETERVAAREEINEMRTQMTGFIEKNSYGEGVIVTLTAAYKEHREKAEATAIDMRGEIDSLKRQVEANKRTIEGLTKSIADKNEHISDLGQKVSALEKENNDLKLQLGKRDKQLAKLKEENDKPQLPDEPPKK